MPVNVPEPSITRAKAPAGVTVSATRSVTLARPSLTVIRNDRSPDADSGGVPEMRWVSALKLIQPGRGLPSASVRL